MIKRNDIINYVIKKFRLGRYLEIGTERGLCFEDVECELKHCVDPVKVYEGLTHEMTSDDFFKINQNSYDVIFIDGLHEHGQVKRDIAHALMFLSLKGFIVIHDTCPMTEEQALPPDQRKTNKWTGDVYKAILDIRSLEDITIWTLDIDWGCTIIKKGRWGNYIPMKVDKCDYQWKSFSDRRRELLNIVTEEAFVRDILKSGMLKNFFNCGGR